MQVVQLLTPLNFLLRLVLSRVTFSGCRPRCSQERTSTSSSHSSNYSPAYVQFHHEQIHTDASCSFLLQDSCYSMFWGFLLFFLVVISTDTKLPDRSNFSYVTLQASPRQIQLSFLWLRKWNLHISSRSPAKESFVLSLSHGLYFVTEGTRPFYSTKAFLSFN